MAEDGKMYILTTLNRATIELVLQLSQINHKLKDYSSNK